MIPAKNCCQVYDWPSTKVLSIGKSGSGKTTLAWKLFLERKARFKFIYDHKAMEFSRRYGLRTCFTQDDMFKVLKQGQGTICYSPMKQFPGRAEEGFEVFCKFVFNVSEKIKGVKLLLADELQRLQGTNSRPEALMEICDIGRTFQIDCYFIASASNTIHNLVKGQITEAYCFLHGPGANCDWEKDFGFEENALFRLRKGLWHWRHEDGRCKIGGNAFG